MKTIFQRIIDREIPARIEHEDERCLVIHDVRPQAPVHLLIIPKKPIARVGEATADDEALLGHLILTAAAVARKLGLDRGYRLVINHDERHCSRIVEQHIEGACRERLV